MSEVTRVGPFELPQEYGWIWPAGLILCVAAICSLAVLFLQRSDAGLSCQYVTPVGLAFLESLGVAGFLLGLSLRGTMARRIVVALLLAVIAGAVGHYVTMTAFAPFCD